MNLSHFVPALRAIVEFEVPEGGNLTGEIVQTAADHLLRFASGEPCLCVEADPDGTAVCLIDIGDDGPVFTTWFDLDAAARIACAYRVNETLYIVVRLASGSIHTLVAIGDETTPVAIRSGAIWGRQEYPGIDEFINAFLETAERWKELLESGYTETPYQVDGTPEICSISFMKKPVRLWPNCMLSSGKGDWWRRNANGSYEILGRQDERAFRLSLKGEGAGFWSDDSLPSYAAVSVFDPASGLLLRELSIDNNVVLEVLGAFRGPVKDLPRRRMQDGNVVEKLFKEKPTDPQYQWFVDQGLYLLHLPKGALTTLERYLVLIQLENGSWRVLLNDKTMPALFLKLLQKWAELSGLSRDENLIFAGIAAQAELSLSENSRPQVKRESLNISHLSLKRCLGNLSGGALVEATALLAAIAEELHRLGEMRMRSS